jgi:excisionase family DNA binding protein
MVCVHQVHRGKRFCLLGLREGSMIKPLLTNAQVCELLKISPATLTRWIRAGKIPHVLLGSGKTKLNVRFREDEIEAWITRRSRGPGGLRVASAAAPSSNGDAKNA